MSQHLRANRFVHPMRTAIFRYCARVVWAPRGIGTSPTRGMHYTNKPSRNQVKRLVVKFGIPDTVRFLSAT